MDAGVPWRLPSFLFILVSTLHPWDSSSYIQDGSSLLSWSSLQTPSLTQPEMCSTVTPQPIKVTMRSDYGMNSLWNLLWDSIKMKADRRDTHTQSDNCLPRVHGRAWDSVMRLCYGQCMRVLLKILFWNSSPTMMLLKDGIIGRWLGLRDYPHVNEKLFLIGLAEPFSFLPVRYNKKVSRSKQRASFLRHQIFWNTGLGFLSPFNRDNTFLLNINWPV